MLRDARLVEAMTPVFRFAPSPTGYLHLGHAFSALQVWRAAEAVGGKVLLRIEDIDPARSRPDHVEAILEDLAWLGFDWSGEVRRQSEHLADHATALSRLEARGLVYRCRLTRTDIASAVDRAELVSGALWPRDPDGAPRLPVEGATANPDERRFAVRLDMGAALATLGRRELVWDERGKGPAGERGEVVAAPADWGDVILARKETPTSYHLAVTVDDALQGVTHVVRGQDLFHATSVHRVLQGLLDLPAPIYAHHRLIPDEAGRKLAKSRGSTPLRDLRAAGWSRDEVFRALDGL